MFLGQHVYKAQILKAKFELRLWHRASSSQLVVDPHPGLPFVAIYPGLAYHADPSKCSCGNPHHHDSMMRAIS